MKLFDQHTIPELLGERFSVRMRFVEPRDASFILKLRTDERLGKFISPTENDLEKQIKWIRQYKSREQKSEEFYFLFESLSGKPYGVSRAYNFCEDSFEIGSWLFSHDTPEGVAILADLATRDYAFISRNVSACKFEVRKANRNVIRYHQRFNPEVICEDNENYYFRLSFEKYIKFRNNLIAVYNHGTR